LNLTNAEPLEAFTKRYSGPPEVWRALLAACDAPALQEWARELGIETFAASTGRIYPREMKAAPLLRRWVQRLRAAGVDFAVRHRWTGLRAGPPLQLQFRVGEETRLFETDAAILALGGASWPITGSNGEWLEAIRALQIEVAPFTPANCGWGAAWSAEVLARAEGQPLKNIVARAAGAEAIGELLVTSYGLEGGAIYTLGPPCARWPRRGSRSISNRCSRSSSSSQR
jgi:predicted flavoprotein YhiN